MPRPILIIALAALAGLAACGTALFVYFMRVTRGASGLRSRISALFVRPSQPAPAAPTSHYYRPYWARR